MSPLGPFNGKSFGTTISPWVVTPDALEPFKETIAPHEKAVAAYLTTENGRKNYSMALQVEITNSDGKSAVCGSSRLESIYWTFSDMIAHQTINGCPLSAGDVLATGTISGETPSSHGCLMEITRGGRETLKIDGFGERRYLEDGDTVRLRGWAGDLGGDSGVGFGECQGLLKGAVVWRQEVRVAGK
jgi:fumarylacetoacetase